MRDSFNLQGIKEVIIKKESGEYKIPVDNDEQIFFSYKMYNNINSLTDTVRLIKKLEDDKEKNLNIIGNFQKSMENLIISLGFEDYKENLVTNERMVDAIKSIKEISNEACNSLLKISKLLGIKNILGDDSFYDKDIFKEIKKIKKENEKNKEHIKNYEDSMEKLINALEIDQSTGKFISNEIMVEKIENFKKHKKNNYKFKKIKKDQVKSILCQNDELNNIFNSEKMVVAICIENNNMYQCIYNKNEKHFSILSQNIGSNVKELSDDFNYYFREIDNCLSEETNSIKQDVKINEVISNIKNTKSKLEEFSEALKSDEGYAYAWFGNLSMWFMDNFGLKETLKREEKVLEFMKFFFNFIPTNKSMISKELLKNRTIPNITKNLENEINKGITKESAEEILQQLKNYSNGLSKYIEKLEGASW